MYSDSKSSQLEIGNKIKDLICGVNESPEFILKRYGSSDLNKKGRHDTKGVQRLLAIIINLITLPIYFIFQLMRRFKL